MKQTRRCGIIRSVFTYAEIANIKVDIDDVTHENCQDFAKSMSEFFEGEQKIAILNARSFESILNIIGNPTDFTNIVRICNFKKSNKTGMYYCTTSRSVAAILIPSGGKNR